MVSCLICANLLIDASHFIRKAIIERALKFWSKDLKDIHINQILGHCAGKSKVLEEKLIEFDLRNFEARLFSGGEADDGDDCLTSDRM